MWTDDDKHIDSQEGPFADQLWLDRLCDYSIICGSGGGLHLSFGRSRGVRRENVGEAGARKKPDLHSSKQFLTKSGLTLDESLEKKALENLN